MTFWTHIQAAQRGEKGNATIEFVIWLPFFIILLGTIADVSLLLNFQSRMFETWASRSLPGRTLSVDVSVANGFVTTKVLAPYSDVLVFGRGFLGDRTITADMTMVMEVTAPAVPNEGV